MNRTLFAPTRESVWDRNAHRLPANASTSGRSGASTHIKTQIQAKTASLAHYELVFVMPLRIFEASRAAHPATARRLATSRGVPEVFAMLTAIILGSHTILILVDLHVS